MPRRDSSESSIPEIAKLLDIRKQGSSGIVLVLGARAGAFYRLSSTFQEIIMGFSERSLHALARPTAFSECYRVLNEHAFSERDLDSIFHAALRDVAVTDADLCLAELVKEEYFSEIITTNIDDLLEQAFSQAGMREGQHYEVFIPGRSYEQSLLHPERRLCRVVKVFGDLVARVYDARRQRSYLDRKIKLKEHLQQVLGSDILAIGLDQRWDAELIDLIPLDGGFSSTWFVDEDLPPPESHMARVFNARQARYITGWDGHYDNFLKALFWHLKSSMPASVKNFFDILSELRKINSEYMIAQRERRETREMLQNTLMQLSSLQQQTEQCFQLVTSELSMLREQLGSLRRLLLRDE
ncbi:SIR2 family protein [Thermogemmatispora carboxidivorans]|uniref:SIR2 family protein n=1 Tax=Thermogemmatispora carboxidivorans TaxID=1382306 RepID=UPI00069B6B51|nr:SIR2 family protein [Thermogemmatispora carboxidivorans]